MAKSFLSYSRGGKTLGASLLLLLLLVLVLALASTGPAQAKEPALDAGPTVATGGVGESGADCFLHHVPTGGTHSVYLLRTVKTTLCPNTGAVAMLLVNGVPQAHGVITAQGSSLRVEANSGDHVIVLIHAIPLFNEISCIRLGELQVELSVHDVPK